MSSRGTSLDFVFSNLISGTYSGASITFHPEGDKLLIPQGNRLVIFDVARGESTSHYIEHPKSITHVAISPKDGYILTSDAENNVFISQLGSSYMCYRKKFKGEVTALAFCPDRKGFAIAFAEKVRIYQYPANVSALKPFISFKRTGGNFRSVTSIDFSPTSNLFITCAEDMTIRILTTDPDEELDPIILTGHRGKPLFAKFNSTGDQITTLGADGTLFVWSIDSEYNVSILSRRRLDEEDFENPKNRYQNIQLAAFNGDSIVTGYSNGSFKTYAIGSINMPALSNFSVTFSSEKVAAIAISDRYAAFTSAKLGEVVVWDLISGAVAQRTQGHYGGVSAFAYSPNGVVVATGGDDGKLKVWDTVSGACLMTFDEHSAPITDVVFAENGRTIVDASLDGSCKAYDVIGARCFHTFEPPERCEFTKVAVDSELKFLAAAERTGLTVFLWSFDTRVLVENLTGHTAPICSLAFTPLCQLVTGSWDGTARVWDFLDSHSSQPFDAHGEVTDVAVSPDGHLLVVANSSGRLTFFTIADATYQGEINIAADAKGGKLLDSDRSAKTTQWYFDTIAFSPDGAFLVCGGRTRFICVYSVQSRLLLRRFPHTSNTEYSGVEGFVRRFHGSGRPEDLVRAQFAEKQIVAAAANRVEWCPTGRGIAAATPEGLLVFVSADDVVADPIELEVDVTPDAVQEAISKGEYVLAVSLGVRLGHTERDLLWEALLSVPDNQIEFVASHLPTHFAPDFLQFLAEMIRKQLEVELLVRWTKSVLMFHTRPMLRDRSTVGVAHLIQKSLSYRVEPVKNIARSNLDTLTFLCNLPE